MLLPEKPLRPVSHFVKHQAKRKQISSRIQFFASHLFGREIRRRPHGIGGLGQADLRAGGYFPVSSRLSFSGVLSGASASTNLATPKSRILASPRFVIKMLAGLMSRWMMPFRWAASSPSAI